MTQMPQPSDTTQPTPSGEEGDTPQRTFRPVVYEQPPDKPSHKPLILLGVSVLLVIGGLIFSGPKADDAQAKSATPDYRSMTADELAKDASVPAAQQLAHRMFNGTQPQKAAVSSAIMQHRRPRLARNMAMAMALEQQKKQQEMMRTMQQRQQEMVEGGW